MKDLKIYELLMRRNPKNDTFEYFDFVRPVNRDISEEKHEIRYNVACYEMDKQVEALVSDYFKNNRVSFKGFDRNCILAKIKWDDEAHKAILDDIGFYEE